jgi:GNAT superfamily N-acetyltransferase
MNIRHIQSDELPQLLELYAFLHPEDSKVDAADPRVASHWLGILENKNLRYFVSEVGGRMISTCTLTIIPNLTRGLRPYGLIENVVTHPASRKQGHGTAVLCHALAEAWKEGCYKVMLETGSKREETLSFYEKAGFKRGIKTGFIAYP